jgi:hypothetical protein
MPSLLVFELMPTIEGVCGVAARNLGTNKGIPVIAPACVSVRNLNVGSSPMIKII